MDYKIKSGARCAVIGYGSWATALASVLSRTEPLTGWWVGNDSVLEGLRETGRNPKYLPHLTFDKTRIAPSSDLNAVVRRAEILVMATPSAYLKNSLAELTEPLDGKFILSAIKGIVPDDYTTVVEYLHDHYGLSFKQLGVITGPSHAEEVALQRLSYLTVVCTSLENSEILRGKFETPATRISCSVDLYGVEYATILKNIYALSVGMAVGLGYGDNFLAVLISNAAREMARFLRESFPAERDTDASAYLGDLLVTCYSAYSRNRSLGMAVGEGASICDALASMTQVSEGYFAADCIRHINLRHRVDMPIADMVHRVLYLRADVREAMAELTLKLV